MLERRLRVDPGEGDLGHHRVLGERRRAHEVPNRLAVTREPRGAVGQVALVLLFANGQAEVGARAQAVDALAALRREEGDDVIPRLQGRDTVADPLDDTRAFVPQHRRRVPGRIGARRGVEVGVAYAAGDQAHEHLARLRLGEGHLLDDERRPELLQHCGANLHADTLEPRSD